MHNYKTGIYIDNKWYIICLFHQAILCWLFIHRFMEKRMLPRTCLQLGTFHYKRLSWLWLCCYLWSTRCWYSDFHYPDILSYGLCLFRLKYESRKICKVCSKEAALTQTTMAFVENVKCAHLHVCVSKHALVLIPRKLTENDWLK